MKTELPVLLLSVFALACGHSHEPGQGHEDVPVPEEFAGQENPLANDEEAAVAGEALYQEHCVECHGETGKGDGAKAQELDPSPRDLSHTVTDHGDDYLLWRITAGGEAPFTSLMPAWEDVLTETEIWQVITYIHTLGDSA